MQKNFMEEIKLIKPAFYGGENCTPGHVFGPAVRRVYLLHYVTSGIGTYTVNGITYTIQAGEAFFIRPGEVTIYQADRNQPWSYIWVGFESALDIFSRVPYHIKKKEIQAVMAPYKNAEMMHDLSELHAAALTWSVAAALTEPMYQPKEENDYVKTAIHIMEQRYTEKLTVQGIAKLLSIDRSYFSNLFKSETGICPQKYLMEYRLKQAVELLQEKRYPISIIAVSVGFPDIVSFSRNFKKQYGVAPNQYIKKRDSSVFSATDGCIRPQSDFD